MASSATPPFTSGLHGPTIRPVRRVVLIAAFFVGMVFATGDAWWMGLAITAIVFDIFVLVWLAMSSDTNGVIGDAPGH